MCRMVFHWSFQLKGGKHAHLSVLRATHDGQYRAANLMTINPLQSASSLPALHPNSASKICTWFYYVA